MNLVNNFLADSLQAESTRLTWDRPRDAGYSVLSNVNVNTIVGGNQIQLSTPVNVEVGYFILQGPYRHRVTVKGTGVTTLTLDSNANFTTGAAKLQVTTLIAVQRRKDAFPVELANGGVYTQNIAVEIFRGYLVIGQTGVASVDVNGNNILTDANAFFTSDLVGRIVRDSSSFNFLIVAVLSSTQLQLQSNDTLHSGPYAILEDFPQDQSRQIQPVKFSQIMAGVGTITDINGFLVDPVNNIFAQPHELIGRVLLDSVGTPYFIIDNTATQLFIHNISASPNLLTFPGYTILQPFNGINKLFFYKDNFLSATQANNRSGTGLEPDTWYYYTAFTKNVSPSPAGENYAPFNDPASTQSYALSPGVRNFGTLLYDYFPELYRETDDPTDATGKPAKSGTGNLQDLMSVFGIQFDLLYSLVETFRLQSADKVSSAVLDQFAYQLNIPPTDAVIGRDVLRRIANDLIDVYKNKGNKESICDFIRIITTWDITNGTGDCDGAILDNLPNVDAFRFFSSALGLLNTRFFGTRSIVPSFLPNSYDPNTGIVSIPKSVDLSTVLIDDYLEMGGLLFRIVGGIEATPVPNGTILFNNTAATGFTYSSITGIVQYVSNVDLSLVNPGDIFFDGNGTPFVIVSVNSGSSNLTIEPGQTIDTTPSPGGGGSVQQGEKRVSLNTGLTLVISTAVIIRVSPEVTIVPSFTPSSYTSGTGFVTVPDSVILASVLPGDIFIDAANNQFTIVGNISDVPGSKHFQIATGQVVNLSSGAVIERVASEVVGKFLKQLPGIIIPGFFTFREFVIDLPKIAMFIETVNGFSVSNGQMTVSFTGAINFGQNNGLVGCIYYPNQAVVKEAFTIVSNTSNTITLNGVPQFINLGDTSVILTPLNSARFQRLNDLIVKIAPFNTRPGFSFINPIAVPI